MATRADPRSRDSPPCPRVGYDSVSGRCRCRNPGVAVVTERETLLAAVLDHPADDTARLVWSDWLEEHGEVSFGRFLRAGVVASKYRCAQVVEDREFFDALAVLAEVAEGGWPGRWVAGLGVGSAPVLPGDWLWDSDEDRVTVRQGDRAGVFARGLLTGLRIAYHEWIGVSGVALERWPLEWVDLRDLPGVRLTIRAPDAEGGRERWALGVEFRSRDRRARGRGRTYTAAVEYPTREALIEGIPMAVPEMVVAVRRQSIDGGV